jgi:hypothetical protein
MHPANRIHRCHLGFEFTPFCLPFLENLDVGVGRIARVVVDPDTLDTTT